MTPICTCCECGVDMLLSNDDSGCYYCPNCGSRTDDGFWEYFEDFMKRLRQRAVQ